jgi:hypothetical protein
MTVRLTLRSSITVGPGATDLAWTTADPPDVGGLWNATQPTRLTVPAGWAGRGLELYTGADVIGLTPAAETVLLLIRKNGSMTLGVQQATASSDGFGDLALTVWDAHAAAGDFYTVRVICSDDSNDRQTVNAIPMTAFQVRTP